MEPGPAGQIHLESTTASKLHFQYICSQTDGHPRSQRQTNIQVYIGTDKQICMHKNRHTWEHMQVHTDTYASHCACSCTHAYARTCVHCMCRCIHSCTIGALLRLNPPRTLASMQFVLQLTHTYTRRQTHRHIHTHTLRETNIHINTRTHMHTYVCTGEQVPGE